MNVSKKLTKLSNYLQNKLLVTDVVGVPKVTSIPIGNIDELGGVSVYELKSVLANLDTIIYYSEMINHEKL